MDGKVAAVFALERIVSSRLTSILMVFCLSCASCAPASLSHHPLDSAILSSVILEPSESFLSSYSDSPFFQEQEDRDKKRGTSMRLAGSDLGASLEDHYIATAPLLPWPPPHPSAFGKVENLPSIGMGDDYSSIDGKLRHLLNERRYQSVSYFSILNSAGFAVLTPLERIDENAMPPKGQTRFVIDKDRAKWTLSDYFKKLFIGDDGRYRMFLFVITDAAFSTGSFDAEAVDLKRWSETGSVQNNPRRWNHVQTKNTKVILLVYEFKMSKGRIRQLVENISGPLPLAYHLKSLGLST